MYKFQMLLQILYKSQTERGHIQKKLFATLLPTQS